MNNKQITIITVGSLNTDLIGLAVPRIINRGELSFGGKLKISAGGKSRNIAEMAAVLLGRNKVAMVGKTAIDPYGLWQVPVKALEARGVNINYIDRVKQQDNEEFPGIALIPVDKEGNNQIYVLPGINKNLSRKDIDKAGALFKAAGRNKGFLILTLEMPLTLIKYAINWAAKYGLRTMLDPGGIIAGDKYADIFNKNIFLLKPNEHEAEILTRVKVINFSSAKKAAKILLDKGVENILITAGDKGAYFFSNNHEKFLPIPQINKSKNYVNETGCGDQTMATICAFLSLGYNLEKAIETGILSGTLQYYKSWVEPVTLREINKQYKMKNIIT